MFKEMKLGAKPILAFMSVAAITLVLGLIGLYGTVNLAARSADSSQNTATRIEASAEKSPNGVDQGPQSNAIHAKESARASEELSGQADQKVLIKWDDSLCIGIEEIDILKGSIPNMFRFFI